LLTVLKIAGCTEQRSWEWLDDPEWQKHGADVQAWMISIQADFQDILEVMVDLLGQHSLSYGCLGRGKPTQLASGGAT
jgi:hypothetical protein